MTEKDKNDIEIDPIWDDDETIRMKKYKKIYASDFDNIPTPSKHLLPQYSPKRLPLCIMEVYEMLGGNDWLRAQAEADPKTFINLLAKLIPKNIDLETSNARPAADLTDQKLHQILQAAGLPIPK